jgi:hypothetical protein
MKKIALFATLLLAGMMARSQTAAAAGNCNGELLTHPAKVQICVPAGWSKEEKDGSLRVKNGKPWTVQLRLEPVDAGDLDAALKRLDAKIGDMVKVEWDKPINIKKDDKDNPNHMDGVVMRGPGKRADTHADVQVIAAIVQAPSGKIIVVSLIADKAFVANDANLAIVRGLLDSIQPAP